MFIVLYHEICVVFTSGTARGGSHLLTAAAVSARCWKYAGAGLPDIVGAKSQCVSWLNCSAFQERDYYGSL